MTTTTDPSRIPIDQHPLGVTAHQSPLLSLVPPLSPPSPLPTHDILLAAATHFPIWTTQTRTRSRPQPARGHTCTRMITALSTATRIDTAWTQCTPPALSKVLPVLPEPNKPPIPVRTPLPLSPATISISISAPTRLLLMPQTIPFRPLVASRNRQ